MASGTQVARTRGQQGTAAAPAQQNNDAPRGMTIREARGYLTSPDVMEQLASACAQGMKPERLVRVALVAMTKAPKLLTCSQASLALALMECGALGLTPNGSLGEAYLVPYWNNKAKRNDAQLQIGYRGLVKLARRSGSVYNVVADVVREGDFFEWEKGLNPRLVHRPAQSGARGDLQYVYAAAWVPEGPPPFDVMDTEEVEAIRQRSKSKDDGPWVTDYFEMAKKTVIRRLCKSLDLSPEAEAAIAHDDAVEYARGPGAGAMRVAHTLIGEVAEIETEGRDPQAASKRLAGQLGAGAQEEEEEGEDLSPPTPKHLIRLEQLMGLAVQHNVLTMDASAELELAIHDGHGPGVRAGIAELEEKLTAAGVELE